MLNQLLVPIARRPVFDVLPVRVSVTPYFSAKAPGLTIMPTSDRTDQANDYGKNSLHSAYLLSPKVMRYITTDEKRANLMFHIPGLTLLP
jgi:hypothetical protein